MPTMKAIVQDRYGTPDLLRLEDVEIPVPDAASALVKVRSASVNALDWRILSGRPLIGRLIFGLTRPKRRIRGVDVSGEVVAVRKSDSRFKVGDAVFGLGSGSFAEYVAADEGELTAKPNGVSFDDAATLGVAAFTALQALRLPGPIRPGQLVAILGAGSGVGTFAVQLARSMGARVTAVTSTENVELLRAIGADVVVDYRKENFPGRPDRYDLVLDISGLYSIGAMLGTLGQDGKLVIVGARGGFGRFLSASLRRRLLRQPTHSFVAHAEVEDLAQLGQLVAQGKVKPVIDRVYSLPEVPAAMTRAALHRARGKLVIHIA